MTTEAHLAAGWILAHLVPGETRRFRALVVFAALAPDLDTLAFFFGEHVYADVHHAYGHNVFFSILVSAFAVWMLPGRAWKVLLFTQLGFYSHYFGDYFFTRFPLHYFWPVSRAGYVYSYEYGLDHPVNIALSYASFVVIIAMAMWWKRTPMEFVSQELDRRLVNLFRRKALACGTCGRGANETCAGCGAPVCMKHGRIGRGFRVRCPVCMAKGREEKLAVAGLPAGGAAGGSAAPVLSTKE